MNFNPSDNGDVILAYCSETDEGVGDFVAVVIKDRHVEFRFDAGSGTAVVRSNYIIQPGVWTKVTIYRDFKSGKLSVNGERYVKGHSPGTAKLVTLNTPVYIGGVNRTKIKISKNVNVTRHFHGCINELAIYGEDLHLLNSTIDLANIEDCEIPAIPWSHSSPLPTVPIFRHETPSPSVIYTSMTPVYNPCDENPCQHGLCQISDSYNGYSCTCEYGYVGINCENVLRQCEMLKPCKNGGSCLEMRGAYKCDCPLRFTGNSCEKQVEIAYDVAFRGDGWLELDRTVMTHEEEREVMGFEISTNRTHGLIMWHGQPANDLNPDDYIALGIIDGYIEYQYNLGSGPALIRVTSQRVDDGERHRIILKRQGTDGSIELNGEHTESGVSDGLKRILNARGNVYLGGVPDYAMTYGRYYSGLSGCIYTLEVQDSGAIDIGEKSIRGKNVFPCTRRI
ncbi:basement membrane-specific heparan sulfate proteoglycan core protein-like isoform X2 [Diachasmimorpha longicaudata]|uniref:basement membrane-specific heparan sulfate proteoglycan core protein-like isoform X2 n=1 Tax=Diachasmimorpha longicaudata TaxID=58733 RepID=UPI0030B8DFE7